MNDSSIPKLLVINDLTGIGRCSMAAALPVISCCGVQACPVTTAVYSNHLGFPTVYSVDLGEHLSSFFEYIEKLSIPFQGICCGFLNSIHQISQIKELMQNIQPDNRLFLDPVMGDHGVLYKNVTTDFLNEMRTLLPYADLITPNLTEACFLTDTSFHESGWNEYELELLIEKLQHYGAKKIIITGITDGNLISNAIYDDRLHLLSIEKAGTFRPGTGDIFVSIISALQLRKLPLCECVKIASEFIRAAILVSDDIPVKEGIAFERCLSMLTNLV